MTLGGLQIKLPFAMQKDFIYRWGIIPLWLLLTTTVFFRQPLPVDETRYLSVAWEMWLRHDFWVPYFNGQAYSHKPPLLFWLFQLGWAVFGVNDWWPKLVGPFAALVNLLLTRKLAQMLWPEQTAIALIAPWILIATLLWTLFATAAMFDILLTCFVLIGMLGLLVLAHGVWGKGLVYLGLAIGFGLLTKGPVIFLHLLPVVVLARFWMDQKAPGVWYGYLLLAAVIGIVIALFWAIPAAIYGGDSYANAIFWKQIADRTIATDIHVRPFFWYLCFLPLVLFPWFYWPRFWQSLWNCRIAEDSGLRFCLIWLLIGFLLFSSLASKQIHYLIPLLPAFALLAARVLDNNVTLPVRVHSDLLPPIVFALLGVFLVLLPQVPGLSRLNWVQTVEPGWGLAVLAIAMVLAKTVLFAGRLSIATMSAALVLAVFVGFICFFQYTGLAFDLRPAALKLKAFNEQGIPCAFVGTYQGQLHFLGRLTQPLPILSLEQVGDWFKAHPDGYLISLEKHKPAAVAYLQAHREYWLVFRNLQQQTPFSPL